MTSSYTIGFLLIGIFRVFSCDFPTSFRLKRDYSGQAWPQLSRKRSICPKSPVGSILVQRTFAGPKQPFLLV
jgi:hypothetical protein